jgi:hypothetical protein
VRARAGGLAPLLIALATAWVASCGYDTGIRLPEAIHGLGVEVFGNDSKQRDLEIEVQEALVDAVERMVHAPLVDPRAADLVLRGRIVNYTRRRGIRNAQNERLETGVLIALEVQLVRRGLDPGSDQPGAGTPPAPRPPGAANRDTTPAAAPGERVVRSLRASQEFGFALADPAGESAARERTIASLADRIVLELVGGFTEPREP